MLAAVVAAANRTGKVSGPVVSDDFSEADGTSMAGKATDTGQTWTRTTGTSTVQSGKATGGGQCHVDSGLANVAVQADLSRGSTDAIGLFARWTDANNSYYFEDYSANCKLVKRVAGSYTQIGGGTAVSIGTYRLEVSGTSLVAKINGVTVIAVTDSSLAGGTKVGFGDFYTAGWSTFSTVDNFTAEAL